jgi:hypothetical protein
MIDRVGCGAEFIPGIAEGRYPEGLGLASHSDAYLTVILGKDPNGTNRNLHVEVAGHDGNDHKDDAIPVACAILSPEVFEVRIIGFQAIDPDWNKLDFCWDARQY